MDYFSDLKRLLDSHIANLKSIAPTEQLNKRIVQHLNRTIDVAKEIALQEPKKSRLLIEYLENESRTFGWSYPENLKEEKCEDSFWQLKNSLEIIIGSMTVNERLYFFGYLDDYEKLNPKHNSDKERIRRMLFIK